MDRETEASQQQGQVHGVVIITLPPADDPSKGKTVTAFAYSDPPPAPPTLPPPPVFQSPTAPRPLRARRFSFSRRRRAIIFLGATIVLFSLWALLFSDGPLELLGGDEDDVRSREEDRRSFVFPLYPKSDGRILRESGGGLKLQSLGARSVDRRARSSALQQLGGNLFPDGQYYTTIFVGDSPRPYFLDVDTGSSLTWIQCDAPCSSCAKGPHPLYKPKRMNLVFPEDSLCLEVQKNKIYEFGDSSKQCDYDIEYADHSSSMGVLARDQMHLLAEDGDELKPKFVFGCAYDQQGQLLASPAKTDGIFGLSNSKVSLPSQLESQGIINNVIGHCIRTEADGGYLFLGDDFVPLWGMTWVPTRHGLSNFYRAVVSRINYGSKQLDVGGSERKLVPLVFDTGSSYTYFPNEPYNSLITSLKFVLRGMVQDESDPTLPVCWKTNIPIRSVEELQKFFDPLTLQFGKKWGVMPITYSIPPEGYLMISSKGNVCLGVLNGTEVHDGSTIILGDISLRGKLVVYDNTQQRIGWIQSECSRPERVKGFPFFL